MATLRKGCKNRDIGTVPNIFGIIIQKEQIKMSHFGDVGLRLDYSWVHIPAKEAMCGRSPRSHEKGVSFMPALSPLFRRAAWLTIAVGCLASCSNMFPIRDASIGTVKGQYATAEYRLISQRKRALKDTDQEIMCTEPSPDVAKAFSTALSASVSQGANSEGASFSQAEAVAQLGKRYATVQLLRGLRFADCEDYANGIIDKVEYGYRMSRYSALVVTLLGIEMVSGENAASPQIVQSLPPPSTNPGGNGGTGAETTPDKEATKEPTTDPAAKTGKTTGQTQSGSTPDIAKLTAAAKTAMAPAAKAVIDASDAYGSIAKSPSESDKEAVTALDAAVTALKKSGPELDQVWTTLSKLTTKPDAATTAALKTASSDQKEAETKVTAADAKCKAASAAVGAACKKVDASSKTVSTAAKALNDLSTALGKVAPKPTPSPGTNNPGSLYRTISDVQAQTIEQMQRNYLDKDNELTMVIPCASAEAELKLPIEAGKLSAFQLFCLDRAKLRIVTPGGTLSDIPSPGATPAGGAGVPASDTGAIDHALNTYFTKEGTGDSAVSAKPADADANTQNTGKAHETAAYKALEVFDYPTAAAEFKQADRDYPTLGNARELAVLLGALGPMTAEDPAQCPALKAVLGPYKYHLPSSTESAIKVRVATLMCKSG
jgi:hypothetical protein